MSRSDVPGKGGVSEFIRHHFRHFNAAVVKDAAEAYIQLLEDGGSMFLAMAGAMSTAEIGLTLAEMIRRDKVHAICCTGANFEEDIFNLVAQKHYVRVPHYRDLTPEDEKELLEKGLNRVTDSCIPEEFTSPPCRIKLVTLFTESPGAVDQFDFRPRRPR